MDSCIIDGKGFNAYSPYRSGCTRCKHFDSLGFICPAFPNAIPDGLLSGKAIHNTVVKGQDGNYILTTK